MTRASDLPALEGDHPGSGRRIVVLDTSVLLSDVHAIDAFEGVDIVIPLTVIEELDSHKSRLDDIGRNARAVTRRIEELRRCAGGDLREPVEVANDTTVRIAINGLQLEEIERLGLPTGKNDNRILAAALGLARSREVTVVSADTNMRIKAASLGLSAEDWSHHVRVSDLTDPGWTTVEVASHVIDELHTAHRVDIPEELTDMVRNSFAVLKSGTQSGLARRMGDDLVQVTSRQRPWNLQSRSKEQGFAIDLLCDPAVEIVALSGTAGTGKTIVTLACALEQTFEPRSARYDRIMIIRPIVAVGRQDIGFLPGTKDEKLGSWFEAVVDTMVALGDKVSHDAAKRTLDIWQESGRLVYEPITYLRGRSLQNTFVIVDEAQNLEGSSLKTILTRVGSGSKIVFLGDTSDGQIDNPYVSATTNALSILVDRFRDEELFGHIRFSRGERSAVASLAAELL